MGDRIALTKGDALLLIDVQNDFVPGGALPVPRGDEVIPVLNRYIQMFRQRGLPIFATRDWHPLNHCSFQAQGGPWPLHCVVGSRGAEFVSSLQLPKNASIISKPSTPDVETYSGFQNASFDDQLRSAQVGRLFVGGLATDYCVLHTSLDALRHGFAVFVLRDAIRAVNVHLHDGDMAQKQLISAGAKRITFEQIET